MCETCFELCSPDGQVQVRLELATVPAPNQHQAPQQRGLYWRVAYGGRPALLPSRLGLELGGAAEFSSCFEVVRVARREWDESWRPVYGERREVRDRARSMAVSLRETIPPRRELELEFRAYDEGAAFCYRLPRQAGLERLAITRERTEFLFPPGTEGYIEYHVEGEYQRLPLERLGRPCERPLTVAYAAGFHGCLHEAGVDNYSRMLLGPLGQERCGVASALSGTVQAETPFQTPWRVLILGERPGDLLERNDLILNLNPPCAIADTSWIRPGKTIREVTLSTRGGYACVDFAVDRGLDYIHYDAGWYGHEYHDEPDARQVAPDPQRTRNIPGYAGLDLPAVIAYAASKGVGVWLYVNRRHLERQVEELLPLYASWGVKGIKPGFVQVGPQEWTVWLHRLVRLAARHRLMVDVHDEYRPTGFSRTYPNLLTQEGVRGNEHMPTARHNCTLPFCRYPAGAADYTPCYYCDRIKTTHAHQLALPVVFYSPAMYLYWYDQPSAYQGEPETEFWRDLPTTWDETRVVQGVIGEYVTVARRRGSVWFVGTITNESARTLGVPLSFLAAETVYAASLYTDAPADDGTRTHVCCRHGLVHAGTTVPARLVPSGGQALRLAPASASEQATWPPLEGTP